MEEEIGEHQMHHSSRKPLTETLRKNPWILSTLILGIFVVLLVAGSGLTGNTISKDEAAQIVLGFAEEQTGETIELDSVTENSGLYEITIIFQDQKIPLYLTKDGKSLVQGLTPLASLDAPAQKQTAATPTDVPKTDKPSVELFIWSYCPYGVQAQGPMAEVVKLLADNADFKAVMYYDGHGEFETQQNKIEECIQKLEPNKYWDYATKFVEEIYPVVSKTRDVADNEAESIKVMDALGIDSDKVLECVDSDGEDLIASASSRAGQLGVTGSPSIVINGVKTNVARNAEAFKAAICDAFTEGNAPDACETVLDSEAAAASGSC